ncbi:MAG: tetratricopeptide repeat protein [Armatimonadetes bacterium]|nr:tetratricopeptide repeat protein [Armatimonadota bacterium]
MRNEEFWHTGQHERCIAMMRLIAQIDPRDFDAYEDGAWLMESALRDEEAEAFLLQGLWSNPDDYEMYSTMGYFCYMRERFDEAVLYYEKAATFDPPKLVWHMLAHSYEHVGYVAQAFNVWWYVRALEPSDPVPHNQIDRIIRGGPPSDVPAFMTRSREQRKAEKGMQ